MKKIIPIAAILLSTTALAGPLEEGMQAYEQDNFGAAAQAFSAAAGNGDPDAQYMLGRLYAKGDGVAEDFVQAYRWYNMAAAGGQRLAAPARDTLAERMSAEQLDEAQAPNSGQQDAAVAAVQPKPAASDDSGTEKLSETTITQIQLNLKRLGYDVGPINGQLGAITLSAIRAYQDEYQLTDSATGWQMLLDHLARNGGNQPPIKRGNPASNALDRPQQNANWRRIL